jgi:hypothetical protein
MQAPDEARNVCFSRKWGTGLRGVYESDSIGLSLVLRRLSTGSIDGYPFDSKVEVVQQFCFQIHACGTGCRSQVSGYGLQVLTHASQAGAEGRACSAWISFLNAEKPAGMAGFSLYPIT